MSTRAASAAISRRAKQHLVNLLFKSDHAKKGREAHKKLDYASYSYLDLRCAYLKRVQSIHPDKVAHSEHSTEELKSGVSGMDDNFGQISRHTWSESNNWKDVAAKSKKEGHDAFIELQEAWNNYDKIAKGMQRGKKESEIRGVQEDFTLFGVGCSFSDSAEESRRRADIMDQAGKGWCSAGLLSERLYDGGPEKMVNISNKSKPVPLVGDDLFTDIPISDDTSMMDACSSETKYKTPSFGLKVRKKSLVDHLVPAYKRSFSR